MTKIDEQTFIKNTNDSNAHRKKCIYILSYFLPINPWAYFSIKSSNMIKQTIIDFHNKNNTGNAMKNIGIVSYWLGTPIFSYDCKIVSGVVFQTKEN